METFVESQGGNDPTDSRNVNRAVNPNGEVNRANAAGVPRAFAASRPRPLSRDITSHPLYQETIKIALSDDAYAKYQARQAERVAFRKQASRDLAIAYLDTRLLLTDQQRKEAEAIAAELPVDTNVPARAVMVKLAAKLDRVSLSEWQRPLLDAAAEEFGRRR